MGFNISRFFVEQILQANPVNILNQKTELVSKWRHKGKHKRRNHQPNQITLKRIVESL